MFADGEVRGLIIRNLLSNTIKFIGLGGSVHAQTERSGDMIVVSVRSFLLVYERLISIDFVEWAAPK